MEDSQTDYLLLRNALEAALLESFALTRVEKLEEAFSLLESANFDVALLDLNLPDSRGLDTFERFHRHQPGLPVVVCSGNQDEEEAIQAVRNGAQDYLVKSQGGFDLTARTIRYAVERHKLLKFLQQSENRFATVFEKSPMAIGISRLRDGKIMHINAAFTRMYDYTREECIGRTAAELGIWANLDERQHFMELLMAQRHVQDFETVARRRSGETRDALVSGEVMEIDNETCLVSQIVDITERKQAEEKLRLSEERHRLVSGTISDYVYSGLAYRDGRARTEWVSGAFERITGYTLEEVNTLPNGFLSLALAEDLQNILSQNPNLFETASLTVEYRIRRKDGQVRWLRDYMQLLYGYETEEAVRRVGAVQDITEQRRIEEALKASQERLRLVLETTSDGFWIVDPTRRFLDVNQAYCAMSGYAREELLRMSIPDVEVNETSQDTDRHIQKILQDGYDRFETRHRRKDGSVFDAEVSVNVMDSTGKVFICFCRDITERKAAEQAIQRHNEQLTTVVQIEHDLATVLNEDLIHKVLSQGIQQLYPDVSTLFISRYDRERGMIKAVYGLHEGSLVDVGSLPEIPLAPEGQGTQSKVIRSGQPLIISNHLKDNLRPSVTTRLGSGDEDNQSAIYIPMSGQKTVLGLIQLQSLLPARFTDEDAQILSLIANTASVAIQNARLYELAQGEIAERKQAEATLRKSEERYRYLFDNNPHPMWAYDLKTLKFLTVNDAAVGKYGYSRDEFMNMTIIDIRPPEEVEKLRVHLQQPRMVVEHSKDWRHKLKDGTVIDVEISSHTLNLSGHEAALVVAQDVTERKAAERALAESEARYRQAITAADAIPYALDYSLNQYTFIGDSIEKLTGYTAREFTPEIFSTLHLESIMQGDLKGMHILEAIPLMRQGQAGQMWKCDHRIRTRSGATRWYSDTAIQILDEDGLPKGSIGIIQDITERKEIELALRQSEEKFRNLSEELEERVLERTAEIEAIHRRLELATQVANLGVWDWNIGSGELFWDDQVYANYGLSKDTFQVSMESFLSIIHPEDVPTLVGFTQEALSGTTSGKIEYRVLRGDNTIGYVKVHGAILFDAGGHPQNIIGVVQDVTQEKLAEQSLRESEEQNRLLFEETPEAVILFNENGQVVRMNHASENLTGYHHDQLVSHSLSYRNLVSPADTERLAEAVVQTLHKTDEFASVEFKINRADGDIRSVGTRVFGLKLLGRQHYLTTMRDITVEKQAEDALRLANAEMERALRLKDEFLANMSHELRTPLNAILGISESLGEQVIGPLNEKQKKYLQTILESGQHLLSLINDILDLAKINAGKIEMEAAQADIASLAESSLRMVRELAHKKGQQLSLDIDPSIASAWIDERRLKQMLVNLLSNAVKFTPEGGSIGLAVHTNARRNSLEFSVWDTGIGIHPDELPRLFQPFVQLDASLTRGAQGTGLGLVLVSQMARLHGGSIQVESTPGSGSRFTISIPWITSPQPAPLDVAAPDPEPNLPVPNENGETRATILLVDDTESVTMLTRDYLEHAGYRVHVAKNGLDAISQAVRTRPQIILMDVMMPEMDGLETVHHLRSLPYFKQTPIIALTALAMPNDRERCFAAGMNDYLSKPVKLQALVSTIEKHLQNQQEQA